METKVNKRRETLLARRNKKQHGNEHSSIDVGLEILCACEVKNPMSLVEIAAYCDCTPERIAQIEQTALMKLRRQRRTLQPCIEQFA